MTRSLAIFAFIFSLSAAAANKEDVVPCQSKGGLESIAAVLNELKADPTSDFLDHSKLSIRNAGVALKTRKGDLVTLRFQVITERSDGDMVVADHYSVELQMAESPDAGCVFKSAKILPE